MRAVAINPANNELISALFLKSKIHKPEMAHFVTCFVDVLLLCEKNLKIPSDISLKNLMLKISKKKNSKPVPFFISEFEF